MKKVDDPLEVAEGRLVMLRATQAMWSQGYDALLHHGVNFKNLPEYKDTKLLDGADKLSFKDGMQLILQWIELVSHEITAVIRRKGFRLASKPPVVPA